MSKTTDGSPITKESPAFTDGTRPSEPTKAAAASLVDVGHHKLRIVRSNLRNDVTIHVGRNSNIELPAILTLDLEDFGRAERTEVPGTSCKPCYRPTARLPPLHHTFLPLREVLVPHARFPGKHHQ
jgi:hypothetical protein